MNTRGAVIKVRLDPMEGRERAGTRPALVVSATFFNEQSELVIVVPITSKIVDRVFPFEVLLDHEALGLGVPSKAMLNQVRTIDKRRVSGQYGLADSSTMQKVDSVLGLTLGLVAI